MDFNSMLNKQKEEAKKGDAYKADSKAGFQKDPRFYEISKDDKGCGKVTVRLIPSFNTDKTALKTYIKRKVHSINVERYLPGQQKPEKRWRTFLCPSTEDSKANCPICQHGFDMYKEDKNAGLDEKVYKAHLGFTSNDEFITNVMIVNDPVNKDNNGKIFLFKLKNSMLNFLDKEAIRVTETLSDFGYMKESDPQGYEQKLSDEGIPLNVEYYDAYNLMGNGKNIQLEYVKKGSEKFKDNTSYWGFSAVARNFTGVVSNTDEYKTLIDKAYCLDEFTEPSKFPDAQQIPSMEALQDELDFLTFKTDKVGQKTPASDKRPNANTVNDVASVATAQETVVEAPRVQTEVQTETKEKVAEVSTTGAQSEEDFLASIMG